MSESIHDNIKHALKTADSLYHRLVLLVGESGSGKTQTLQAVADDVGTSVINVNLLLSTELLELSTKRRALRLTSLLDDALADCAPPLMLDNLEMLFAIQLRQDPLRLLQEISRNQVVLASWNGKYEASKLLYATPDHPEYRCYEPVDTPIITMSGINSLDKSTNSQ